MDNEQRTSSHLFGRRKGRPLRVRKTRLMEELLPRLLITLEESTPVPPQAFFPADPQPSAWLEIGFGGGEHLAAQAKLNPDVCFIGCEPFVNGVASLLDHLDRDGIQNVRVFNDDARVMCDALTEASLDKCFVLFADPWPKKRHAERRFIGPENLARLSRVLKSGAILRVASDDAQLVEWMRECLEAHADFTCAYASIEPPADWVQTRYQEKAIKAGRQPFFMDYRRNDR
jgi:tRNA (guanine-N7-)-methyltransferase